MSSLQYTLAQKKKKGKKDFVICILNHIRDNRSIFPSSNSAHVFQEQILTRPARERTSCGAFCYFFLEK